MELTGITAKQQTDRRLFFALWPNDDVRGQLTAVSRLCSQNNVGKPMDHRNLHLTLVFLGNVDESGMECVRDMAAKVQASAFRLQLDTSGWFKKPRVAWIGSEQTPDHLLNLVSQLRAGSVQCGLPVDDFPFKVHITLQRKVQRFQSFEVKPVEWSVDDFVLVQSRTYPEGVEYRVINQWLLSGQAS